MTRSRRSQETGSLVERGSTVVEMLVRQPVKEAVREALAEERASEAVQSRTEPGRTTDSAGGSSSGGDGGSTLGRILFLAALVGVAYYVLQRRDVGSDLTEQVGVGETEGGGPTVEDPLSPEREETSEDVTEDRTDEGPTTPS